MPGTGLDILQEILSLSPPVNLLMLVLKIFPFYREGSGGGITCLRGLRQEEEAPDSSGAQLLQTLLWFPTICNAPGMSFLPTMPFSDSLFKMSSEDKSK